MQYPYLSGRSPMRRLWAPWRNVYLSRMRKPTKKSLRDPAAKGEPRQRWEAKPPEALHSGKQITQPSGARGCFLCKARKYTSARTDTNNLVITRTKTALAVMNRYPYNAGHLLIAPGRHKGNLEDLTPPEIQELFDLLKEMKKRLTRVLKPEGFNIGINLGRVAGAGLVDHLHIHLVPRWKGDTNFMPIISNTKVVSQALQDLYKQLTSSVSSRRGH